VSKPDGRSERYNASDIVERQVTAGRGDALAIIADDASLTYEQLRRQVNRAGNLLRELGVRREQRVLLVLDEVAVLDRVASALADRSVRWLVRDRAGADVVEFEEAMRAQSDQLDAAATHRDDMGFWLYSSGSTGKPKGVVHLQHDIEVTCENYARRVLGLRAQDVTFSTTKLFHAYGLGNGLSFPLWFGSTAVLMSGPTRPRPILEMLRRHRPTVFFSVPALFGAMLREPGADGALDSVRFCVSAAEPLPPTTIARWRERFGVDIVDGIGSTEMLHIYCSNQPGRIEPGTTGWPVPGYTLRLVDDGGTATGGAGDRRAAGAGRLVCRLLLAPARKDQGLNVGRLVCDGRPL
jgi:acyl-coenzyme A synthetase/AMP-(fatty) acid ligase